mgnify:CR=1 FL=1
MIYVIEGVDCSGKSTIIQGIKKRLNNGLDTEVIHSTFPQGETLEEKYEFQVKYFTDLINMLIANQHKKNFILDRAWIPEKFYSPMYRNREAEYIDNLEQRLIDNVTPNLIRNVLVEAPVEDIEYRFNTYRGEDDPCPPREDIVELIGLFRKATSSALSHYITAHNDNSTDVELIIDSIM